jgi:hypothetical protein
MVTVDFDDVITALFFFIKLFFYHLPSAATIYRNLPVFREQNRQLYLFRYRLGNDFRSNYVVK